MTPEEHKAENRRLQEKVQKLWWANMLAMIIGFPVVIALIIVLM